MKIQAIILDWAGTTLDYGSRAPVAVLEEVFALYDVPLERKEARVYMGLLKVDHIRSTLGIPAVRKRWTERHGVPPTEQDVQQLFAEFIPRQLSCLESYSDLIPGVAEAVERFRSRGIRLGSTTGYTRPMLDLLIAKAAQQGYSPDASVVPDEVGAGRPAPFMCYLNAVKLRTYPLSACVKIGDTPSDIEEGRNAGMWTIGIAKTGNEVGLTEAEFEALSKEAAEARLQKARERLSRADFVVDSVADCDAVLDEIDRKLG
jgi:phosphonoacetaldehyde hydrolase